MPTFMELLKRAYEIEVRAVNAYREAISELQRRGLLHPAIRDILLKMLLDSIVHLNIVRAVIASLEELNTTARRLVGVGEAEGAERLGRDHVAILLRIVEEHESIEKDSVKLYEEAAEKAPTRLLAEILRAIAEDEKRHDEYVVEARKLLEKLYGRRG